MSPKIGMSSLINETKSRTWTQTLQQLLEDVISCGYIASVSSSPRPYIMSGCTDGVCTMDICLPRLTDWLAAFSLNHSIGMGNVTVNFSVLEELSNDTEDENFVPESVCRSRTTVAVWIVQTVLYVSLTADVDVIRFSQMCCNWMKT